MSFDGFNTLSNGLTSGCKAEGVRTDDSSSSLDTKDKFISKQFDNALRKILHIATLLHAYLPFKSFKLCTHNLITPVITKMIVLVQCRQYRDQSDHLDRHGWDHLDHLDHRRAGCSTAVRGWADLRSRRRQRRHHRRLARPAFPSWADGNSQRKYVKVTQIRSELG